MTPGAPRTQQCFLSLTPPGTSLPHRAPSPPCPQADPLSLAVQGPHCHSHLWSRDSCFCPLQEIWSTPSITCQRYTYQEALPGRSTAHQRATSEKGGDWAAELPSPLTPAPHQKAVFLPQDPLTAMHLFLPQFHQQL